MTQYVGRQKLGEVGENLELPNISPSPAARVRARMQHQADDSDEESNS